MNEKEMNALIRLLDDSDNEIFSLVRERLVSLGKPAIPFLENTWGRSFDAMLQGRIETIIHQIQFHSLQEELAAWKREGTHDLLKGALLIAKYQYPDLDEEKVRLQLEQIRKDVWLELNDSLTALEIVRVMNHIIFDVHGFSGNTANYHAPQNSYINIVLESKKGNPLSLAIIYCIVSHNLELPIFGINLPEHFILAYREGAAAPEKGEILFYINAFSRGTVFHRKEIDQFLKQLNLAQEKSFYEPCSNLDMVQRLARNLINSYQKLGYVDKVSELEILLGTLL